MPPTFDFTVRFFGALVTFIPKTDACLNALRELVPTPHEWTSDDTCSVSKKQAEVLLRSLRSNGFALQY